MIEVGNGSATPEEAAAIAAAIQQFIAETNPVAGEGPKQNPWQRAALREGIVSGDELLARIALLPVEDAHKARIAHALDALVRRPNARPED